MRKQNDNSVEFGCIKEVSQSILASHQTLPFRISIDNTSLKVFGDLLNVVPQFLRDVFVLEGEFDVGLDESLLVADGVAFSVEESVVHGLVRQH